MIQFEWDEQKNQANIRKHGVSFELAQQIFHGPVFRQEDIRRNYGEVRYISIGKVEDIAVLVVVHTNRTRGIRIISARSASSKERDTYEEKIQQGFKAQTNFRTQ